MRYRQRLRSRIVLSFVLLGFGLTAMFALSTWLLRARMESELVESTLQREVDSLLAQVKANPEREAQSTLVEAATFSEAKLYKAPIAWQSLGTGVHDLSEVDAQGRTRHYKLAVRRDAGLISFVRYDYTDASLDARQLATTLLGSVILFTLLAWLLGVWASNRVMRPVRDLARRLGQLAGRDQHEALAPHFAHDEVGQLAAALDGYAARMTALVKRDREFNSDVSHELRTPLAVIRGAAELLLSNPDIPEKTRQRLQRIERAALQCTDLTTALLLLSRSERGQGRTDLHKLALQLAESGRIQLGNKPVEVVVQCEGLRTGEIPWVDAPEAVLAVALGNLIGNACKYTAEGEVRIRVTPDQVSIEDTGPGLSKEDAERLFERGYRGSGAGSTSGGGIGLSIVRRLCELYGWTVSIAPREERGAVAVLRFS